MKVKIIKCSEQAFWYKNHIGDVFEVEKGYKGDFKVDDNNKYKINNTFLNRDFVIDKEDCEIIKENDMKELKIGDEVEVPSCGTWTKVIFIKYSENDSIICVHSHEGYRFKQGETFSTTKYLKGEWRTIKEPTYRPFTFEDREVFRNKWIKHKEYNDEYLILSCSCLEIRTSTGDLRYDTIFNKYIFLDGSPCGVEIKE